MPTTELQSVLSNDNKPFMHSMDQATDKAKKAGKEIESAFASPFKQLGETLKGGFAEVLGVGAVLEFTHSIVEMGSELQDSADRLDLSTDALQELGYAFGQSGAKQEDFEKGMVKLNQSIEKALDDDDKALAAFQKLGVTFGDLQSKNPEEILYKIADGMRDAKDPTEALAAAMELLGKSGIKLIPGLKLGADGLRELGAEVEKLSKAGVNRLDDLGDAFSRAYKSFKAFSANVLTGTGSKWEKGISDAIGFKTLWDAKGAIAPPDFGKGYSPKGMFPGDTGFNPDEEDPEKLDPERKSAKFSLKSPEERHAYAKAILDEEAKQEKENADFIEKDLESRQRSYLEVKKINEDTMRIQEDTGRIGMSSEEKIVDLERERVQWLREAVRLEKDMMDLGIHQKEAAMARQRVAKIGQEITQEHQRVEPGLGKTLFDQNAEAMREGMISKYMHGGGGPTIADSPEGFKGGGSLTSGGLTSGPAGGGLRTGGLNGHASHVIRHGDAARTKAAAQAAKDQNKGVEGKLGTIITLLDTQPKPTQ